ncbi:MAG TPA: biosynthetic-type acetolactate synthase large subunit [Clostridiales bacterium]|nr:biosynthetic-type acetolactate synthase large subunit [Clostridiales bacterium]
MKEEKVIKNGAEIVISVLLEEGVTDIFGYPGGTILNVYDELYKNQDKIKHYLTAHEQGAAHAADAYARVTGKVGVCFATSGPGATNIVTGVANAYMDSIPMVAITCNVAKSLLGKDSFQEVDIAGITMPVTKHNYIVGSIEELADILREAFYIAKEGRPGPVLVDIPKNITVEKTEFIPKTPKKYVPSMECSKKDISTVAEKINSAKNIFILAGGGVITSNASKELRALVKKLDAPVALTLMAQGAVSSYDPYFTGMIGMHGTKSSNLGLKASDMLIAIGTRFSDRVLTSASQFIKKMTVIHIDIDSAEMNKNIGSNYQLIGDAKVILQKLLPLIKERKNPEFLKKVHGFARGDKVDLQKMSPYNIISHISDVTKGDAIITTEVGQNQMWAARYYKYTNPRTLITSGGLGAMGFGTGASIGSQVAAKDKKVIAIAGDGSFRMNSTELATISYYNLPIIIVILNNKTLGMVRQWQTLFYEKRYSQTTLDRGPDFVKLADAYGIDSYRANTLEEFKTAFDTAIEKGVPALIDANIDIDECVYPMVEAGKAIDKMITSLT